MPSGRVPAQDESASVREAAVSLLGRHISAHQDLAETYFETVTSACQDSSTSVRKSALKILWEACIQPAGFGRGTEACIILLQHVNDPEPSIQEFVGRTVSKLWLPDQKGADFPVQCAPPIDHIVPFALCTSPKVSKVTRAP